MTFEELFADLSAKVVAGMPGSRTVEEHAKGVHFIEGRQDAPQAKVGAAPVDEESEVL